MIAMNASIFYICLIAILLTHDSQAQTTFEIRDSIFPGERVSSGLPMAVVDMNGDLMDDVVFLDQGSELYIGYQNPQGDFNKFFVGPTNGKEQWAMAVADLDRNGWRDIVVCGAFDWIWIYYQDQGVFSLDRLSIQNEYAQGTNLVDINGDGWLDIHMCNDVGSNVVWWNRQDSFERDTTGLFDVLTGQDAEGNYSSEWGDVDNDGDLDLYVTKCSAAATEPTDLRRVNQLFIQDSNGRFHEEAALRGAASGEQGWTGHLFDIDNDFDLDLLVTNHNTLAEVLINIDSGYYFNDTRNTGLNIRGPVIQCFSTDFNMDGHSDIAGGNIPDFVYINNGRRFYSRMPEALGDYDVLSMACGDLNRDHHPDLYGSAGNLINLPSSISDRIMYNPWQGRNYFTVYLQGSESNMDGVGAKIYLYYVGGQQMRTVQSGQSYGIQNSYQIDFGTGVWNQEIDSCIVVWPSGQVQKQYGGSIGQYAVFWEDHGIWLEENLDWGENILACSGDTVVLKGYPGYSMQWQDTVFTTEYKVTQTELVRPALIDSSGNILRLPAVYVEFNPAPEVSITVDDGENGSCADSVRLRLLGSHDRDSLFWENGGDTPIWISEAQVINACGISPCGTKVSDSMEVFLAELPKWLELKNDTVGKSLDGRLIARLDTGKVQWYASIDSDSVLFEGDTLLVDSIYRDTTFWVEGSYERKRTTFTVGEKKGQKQGVFLTEVENPRTIIALQEDHFLEQAWVYTDTAGTRMFDLMNSDKTIVAEWSIALDSGWNEIELPVFMDSEKSPYSLGTRDSINIDELGSRSPRLWTLEDEIRYPYAKEGVKVLQLNTGYARYGYFFDLIFTQAPEKCAEGRVPLTVYLDSTTNIEDLQEFGYDIYPNPSNGDFYIDAKGVKGDLSVELTDLQGRAMDYQIWHAGHQGSPIKLRLEQPGIYLLNLNGRVSRVVVRP